MSNIRAAPYTLKDPDDDAAFAALKDDVTLLKIEVHRGSDAVAFVTEEEEDESSSSLSWVKATRRLSAGSLVDGAEATMTYDTVTGTSLANMSAGTGIFTATENGIYMMTVSAYVNINLPAASRHDVVIYIRSYHNNTANPLSTAGINTGDSTVVAPSGYTAPYLCLSDVVYLTEGQTLFARAYADGPAGSTNLEYGDVILQIARVA